MCIRKTVEKQTTLNAYLDSLYFSKKDIHLLKMEKRIRVNGKAVCDDVVLNGEDELQIDIRKEEPINIIAVDGNIQILYEDDYCLVVDKQPGIIIHDDSTGISTLDNFVAFYYQSTNQNHHVYHVHRLDKETSGAVLYCKEEFLVAVFDKMLQNKEITRIYQAKVDGLIEKEMTIRKNIGRDRHNASKYRISATGKEAVTHVKPLQTVGKKTLVECLLETGRTHQIRVHLSSIGHPIMGDLLYGGSKGERMMLHSSRIQFMHPVSGKAICVESPITF